VPSVGEPHEGGNGEAGDETPTCAAALVIVAADAVPESEAAEMRVKNAATRMIGLSLDRISCFPFLIRPLLSLVA
jgi:hypothetical protein